MNYHRLFFPACFCLGALLFTSCTKDQTAQTGYPKEVEDILVKKCATSGCHNTKSKGAAGGIDLSSWDKLFEGGRNGTPVIPFSVDYSYLLYFVNTYPDIDSNILQPTMPLSRAPLTRNEIYTLRSWIANGAPGNTGMIKFADNAQRRKIYVANQACDQVAVFDADSKVIMRYIHVGVDDALIEAPHQVKVSPDGQYWYVLFYNGHIIQKFRAADDSYMGSIEIGNGIWNTLAISPDGTKGFASSLEQNGKVAYIDLAGMQLIVYYTGLEYPHGTWVSRDGNTLCVTSQYGNYMNKLDITDPLSPSIDYVVLQPGQPRTTNSTYDPHEVIFSPDGSKYFLSCQFSNEVRVMQTSNDSLLAVIPVGTKPQEMSLSHTRPYLFVTCQEDASFGLGFKGSVAVINYNTLAIVVPGGIYTGFQPHGIAVDDDNDKVYVANLNYDPTGPAPHHSTDCGGRNGYLSMVDMNTLQLHTISTPDGITYTYQNELLPFPYSVAFRK